MKVVPALPTGRQVRVRAPGKINLSLRSGALEDDGYHPLATTFQAVSLYEEVIASVSDEISVRATGYQAALVPTDGTNLAVKAAELLARHAGIADGVDLHLVKGVPVAGGMAGGSADAAATLVACDALWHTGLGRDELLELASELGADVPFALLGSTAVGTGRGHLLSPVLARGEFHWVLALRHDGLSTGAVYEAFDTTTSGEATLAPDADRGLMLALRAGDPVALGAALHNDLQEAALSLAPELAETIAAGLEAGALGAIVSGSGPTVAMLARDAEHAVFLAAVLTAEVVADELRMVTGPVPGARLLVSVHPQRD